MAAYVITQESTGTDLATVHDFFNARRMAEAWATVPDAGTLIISRVFEAGPRKGERVPIGTRTAAPAVVMTRSGPQTLLPGFTIPDEPSGQRRLM